MMFAIVRQTLADWLAKHRVTQLPPEVNRLRWSAIPRGKTGSRGDFNELGEVTELRDNRPPLKQADIDVFVPDSGLDLEG